MTKVGYIFFNKASKNGFNWVS